jgi:tetratricopeptide (TPR) repeat protein
MRDSTSRAGLSKHGGEKIMDSNMATNNLNTHAIGLFRSGITPIDRLQKTTVGRQEMLDDLIEKLHRGADKKGVQHYVFIGPRGIGKTHFLTLLESAVGSDEDLSKRYTIIRFPEENIRVLSFADMLLSIVEILSETVQNDEWSELYKSQSTNEDDQSVIDAIVPRLKNYRTLTGKMLLLLLENLDALLSQQIKDQQDIHRLRTFLMDSPCVTLVSTSPVYFPGLYDVKSPLYDFFDVQIIDDLSEEQTIEVIKRNLEWEKRDDILKNFGAIVPQIKTIHTMTGGNPRLIMMLYQLVANDAILDTKVQFQKLLDQISPFYQDRLRDLAPQERAVLETIALMRDEPRTPAAVAKRLRKSPQMVSSLLQRMAKAGYLTSIENTQDKRSRIYRIKEGFFDLWLAMSESRLHKKRLPYLVDFLSHYYQDQAKREQKREELKKLYESPECDETKKKNSREMLDYLSDIGDKNEQFVSKLDLAVQGVKEGRPVYALEYFKEIEPIAPVKPVFEWMVEQTEKSNLKRPAEDIEKWFTNLIDYWKNQRSGDLEKAAEIAQNLGDDFSDHGLHLIRIELLKDVIEHTSDEKTKIALLIDIAYCRQIIGQVDLAFEELIKALELSKNINDRIGEGRTLNKIGQVYSGSCDYDKAIGYLGQSLSIMQAIKNRQGEAAALNNISQIYFNQGEYSNALTFLNQSIAICLEIHDKYGEGATQNNMGQLDFIHGDYENALNHFNQSLAIKQEINDKAGLCATYFNIGHTFWAKKDSSQAMQSWANAYKLAKSIQLVQALDKLKSLAEILNLPGGMDAWEKLANKEGNA